MPAREGPSLTVDELRAIHDLAALQQQKKQVVQTLESNRAAILKLAEKLRAKEERKKELGLSLSASESTLTLNGTYRVDDFRLPPHQRARERLPPKPFSHEDVEPAAIKDPRILSIRLENIKRTTCKREIARVVKGKEDREVERAAREARKVRILPKIKVPASMLPNRYTRGELPCTIEHGLSGQYLSWAAPLDNLDYEYYLPIFFDGLQCKENPARFIARQGIDDLIYAARGYPERIIPCIKNLVRPIRNALSKFDTEILLGVLKALQLLVTSNVGVGQALLPYSKQFLAPIASVLDMNKNIGDAMDYGQRKDDDVGENVRKTLELLEERGGPGAFQSIKFCVPLYESCLKNPARQKSHEGGGIGGGIKGARGGH